MFFEFFNENLDFFLENQKKSIFLMIFFDRSKKYFLKKLEKNPDINIEVEIHCGSNGSTPSLYKPLQMCFLDRVSFFCIFVTYQIPTWWNPLPCSSLRGVGLFLSRGAFQIRSRNTEPQPRAYVFSNQLCMLAVRLQIAEHNL